MSETIPDFEKLRQPKEVQGAIGKILVPQYLTMEQVQECWDNNIAVPLDIVPIEFWHTPDMEFPHFSEEVYGKDF